MGILLCCPKSKPESISTNNFKIRTVDSELILDHNRHFTPYVDIQKTDSMNTVRTQRKTERKSTPLSKFMDVRCSAFGVCERGLSHRNENSIIDKINDMIYDIEEDQLRSDMWYKSVLLNLEKIKKPLLF